MSTYGTRTVRRQSPRQVEDFELTKADEMRLAKRKSERTWKKREVA